MYAKLLLVAALLIHQDKAPSCHLKAAKKLCMVCHKERSPNKEQSRQLFTWERQAIFLEGSHQRLTQARLPGTSWGGGNGHPTSQELRSIHGLY